MQEPGIEELLGHDLSLPCFLYICHYNVARRLNKLCRRTVAFYVFFICICNYFSPPTAMQDPQGEIHRSKLAFEREPSVSEDTQSRRGE